jgi:hypothetical protein
MHIQAKDGEIITERLKALTQSTMNRFKQELIAICQMGDDFCIKKLEVYIDQLIQPLILCLLASGATDPLPATSEPLITSVLSALQTKNSELESQLLIAKRKLE